MSLFISIALLALISITLNGDAWRSKVFIGLTLLAVFIAVQISKKTNALIASAWAWAMISALFICVSPFSVYSNYGSLASVSFSSLSAQSAVWLLLCSVPFL